MSCTITALPFSLRFLTTILGMSDVEGLGIIQDNSYEYGALNAIDNGNFNMANQLTSKIEMVNTSYQTAFTDSDLLIKTLKEHGIENFEINNDDIKCTVQNYTLSFTRNSQDDAFILNITCPKNCNIDDKINDLNQEYTMNVQEESYLSIINKLKENNMSLESEEVLEDNTIVLTINVE